MKKRKKQSFTARGKLPGAAGATAYFKRRKAMSRKPHDDDEGMRSEPRHTQAVSESGAKEAAPSPEEVDRAVMMMSGHVSSAVPQEALQAGEYELPESDNLRRMQNKKIPDGSYRVTGHEWILDFADGHLVKIARATTASERSSYTSIPQPREAAGS